MITRGMLKKLLALLVALPALFLLLATVIIPAVFYATAGRVHADAAAVPAQGEAPVDPRWAFAAAESARLARARVANDNLPGLSVAVGVDGRLAWAGGFGWADVEAKRPVTPDTRFRIGTLSQPLTAAGAGLLVARGTLDLDVPVQRYVPTFPGKSSPISMRHAMSHTAGFRHPHIEDACRHDARDAGPNPGLALFADEPLRYTPGTAFRYSSYGWILASAVVESVAGEPFARFLSRSVFAPLGMHGTVPDDAAQPPPERAQLYHPRASADMATGLEHPDFTDYGCYAGAGMYLSTPSDLVRFGLAMDGHALLDPKTTAMLESPVTLPSGTSTGHGMGWWASKTAFGAGDTLLLDHPGITIGATSSLQRYPEHGIVVAVSSNVTFADVAPLAAQVAALFASARAAAREVERESPTIAAPVASPGS